MVDVQGVLLFFIALPVFVGFLELLGRALDHVWPPPPGPSPEEYNRQVHAEYNRQVEKWHEKRSAIAQWGCPSTSPETPSGCAGNCYCLPPYPTRPFSW